MFNTSYGRLGFTASTGALYGEQIIDWVKIRGYKYVSEASLTTTTRTIIIIMNKTITKKEYITITETQTNTIVKATTITKTQVMREKNQVYALITLLLLALAVIFYIMYLTRR